MENVLAITIGEDRIQGLVLESGPQTMQVLQYISVDRREDELEVSLSSLKDQLKHQVTRCRVALGAHTFLHRNLSFPFQERQKIEKTLPMELEEVTIYGGQDLHGDFIVFPDVEGGAEVVAALMPKQEMAEILAALQGQGVDPELVTVRGLPEASGLLSRDTGETSFLLLDINGARCTFILVEEGQICLMRSLQLMSSLDLPLNEKVEADVEQCVEHLSGMVHTTLLSAGKSALLQDSLPCFVSGDTINQHVLDHLLRGLEQPVKRYEAADRPLLKVEPTLEDEWAAADLNGTLSLALCTTKGSTILNLRSGIFRKRRSAKQLRTLGMRAVLPAVACFFVLIVLGIMQIQGLKRERDSLNNEIMTIFRQTLPEVTKIQDPLKQMEIRVKETRDLYSGSNSNESFKKLDLLAELSTRIPHALPIRLTRFVADRDDLRLRGETKDFNTVDNVQKELEKSLYFGSVEISSANLAPKGDGVRFELKLDYNRE